MAHFIAHRSFNAISPCSQPVNFIALLAEMMLFRAHIDSHPRGTIDFLTHQHLRDRALSPCAWDESQIST
ncbi:hypothetical protein F5X96DRAFT_622225 [Biscogniauxia mediterranea]|nr:hypothetical protein F5X96DRAFT_622225 [Biscogniauxia mediterranea]